MSAADHIASGVAKHLFAFKAHRQHVDLILECERAASRRNPRDRDPKRWSKSAWRRYLYTAATHQAS